MASEFSSGAGRTDADPRATTLLVSSGPVSGDDLSSTLFAAHALPGYSILREVSRGGQGVVFEAIQQSTARRVAVKVLKEGPFAGPADRARFDREARILAQLSHPSIVAVHDCGVAAGCYYLVMDFVDGRPLDAFVAGEFAGPGDDGDAGLIQPDIPRTLKLFVKVCEAVAAAHERGIMHRDLKPRNILVTNEGQPKVLDFGLAKMTAASGSDTPGTGVTSITGEFLGSLPWASPEQAGGRQKWIDVRTDVYSLGVVLYQLLTGRFPYDVTGEIGDVLSTITEVEPIHPIAVNRRIRRELETILLKALAKEPARRYQTAGELADDLRRFLAGEPILARRQSLAYLLRKRSGTLARRHVIVCNLGVILIAFALAHFLATPIVFEWTDLDRLFRNQVLPGSFGITGEGVLDSIRIIQVTDATDVDELAKREGLPQVRREDWSSVRALHGRLMEKLASSGARVVVFDLKFVLPKAVDDYFVRGTNALVAAGIPVVVAVKGWWFDAPPAVSPAIAPFVRWGSDEAGFTKTDPWQLVVANQRGEAEALPTLALTTYGALREPEAEISVTYDRPGERVVLGYWRRNPEVPQARQRLRARTDRIKLGEIVTAPDDIPGTDRMKGDLIGQTIIGMPSDDVLASISVEYQDAFSAEAAELRRLFENRIVLIGDLRSGVDRHPHPDGRMLPGCYGQAVGIDALVRTVTLHRMTTEFEYAAVGSGAVLGGFLGGFRWRRRGLRAVALVGLAALGIGFSILACHLTGAWCDPLIPTTAMVLACGLGGIVNRFLGQNNVTGVEQET